MGLARASILGKTKTKISKRYGKAEPSRLDIRLFERPQRIKSGQPRRLRKREKRRLLALRKIARYQLLDSALPRRILYIHTHHSQPSDSNHDAVARM